MKIAKRFWGIALASCVLFAGACASDEESDEANRRVAELEQEKKALSDQVVDANGSRALMQQQVDNQRAEIASLRKSPSTGVGAKTDEETSPGIGAAPSKTAEKPVTDLRKPGHTLDSLESKTIDVIDNKNGSTTVRLTGNLFNSGSHELTATGRETLKRVGAALKKAGTAHISVEGHTDLTPMKKSKTTYGTNRALSMARALEVQTYLTNDCGISEKSMSVVGHGDTRPLAAGVSKEANEKNRRVELVVTN